MDDPSFHVGQWVRMPRYDGEIGKIVGVTTTGVFQVQRLRQGYAVRMMPDELQRLDAADANYHDDIPVTTAEQIGPGKKGTDDPSAA
jgi:hypothetical protein